MQGVHYGDGSYLLGTVVSPLILGQTQPLLVPGGPILAAPVFPLDTAPWLSSILVAWEAGALSIIGLRVGVGGNTGEDWLVDEEPSCEEPHLWL